MNDDGLITLCIEPTSKSEEGDRWICVIDHDGNINGTVPDIYRKALEVVSETLITKVGKIIENGAPVHSLQTQRIFNRRAQYRLSTTGILRQPATK